MRPLIFAAGFILMTMLQQILLINKEITIITMLFSDLKLKK